MRKLGVLLCIFLLAGCTAMDALDAINPMKDDKGINTNVQLGKENHSEENKQLVRAKLDHTENSTAGRDQFFTANTNIPWWTAILLLFVRPMVIIKDTIDLFRRKR